MNLVTKSAIDFTASSVLSDGEIVDDFCLSKRIKISMLSFFLST